MLQAFEQEHGDLSDGRRRLRAQLARLDTTLLGVPVRMDGNRQAVVSSSLVRLGPESASGLPELRPVQTVPGVDQSVGGLLPTSYVSTAAGEPCRRALRRPLGEVSQPAIVHVKRVPSSRGARPPGRSPRRTRTVVTLGLDRERGAGSAQTRRPPAIGQARRRRRPAERATATSAARRGLDDDRLGGDAEPALDGERRVREQPAGVAPVRCRCSLPRAAARARGRAPARRRARPPPSRARTPRTAPAPARPAEPARRRGSRRRTASRRAARAAARPRAARRARRRRAARRPARSRGGRGRAPA